MTPTTLRPLAARCAVAMAVALSGSVASAALIGGPDIIAAPVSVLDTVVANTHQQGFDERQGVTLGAAVAVDGGSIAAGTVVDSHMIFFNQEASIRTTATDTQTWTFDGIIIGVMSDAGGLLEAASNAVLGAAGTLYPGAFAARGLEAGTADFYTVVGNTITVRMQVAQPGDWIRVVTAVPEPSSIALLGLAMAGLGALRRRRG